MPFSAFFACPPCEPAHTYTHCMCQRYTGTQQQTVLLAVKHPIGLTEVMLVLGEVELCRENASLRTMRSPKGPI